MDSSSWYSCNFSFSSTFIRIVLCKVEERLARCFTSHRAPVLETVRLTQVSSPSVSILYLFCQCEESSLSDTSTYSLLKLHLPQGKRETLSPANAFERWDTFRSAGLLISTKCGGNWEELEQMHAMNTKNARQVCPYPSEWTWINDSRICREEARTCHRCLWESKIRHPRLMGKIPTYMCWCLQSRETDESQYNVKVFL